MDVLLIPCFARPELLHETLRNLVATGDLSTVHVVFKPDRGYHPDIHKVIAMFDLPSWEVKQARVSHYKMTKQSLNVLDGYVYAATLTDGLVFMVEEDVQVATDFFRFNRELFNQQPDLFASISRTNTNRSVEVAEDPEAYYLSTGDYSSIGVAMKAQTIREHIAPHLNERYLRDCITYCDQTFPDSGIPRGHAEQDGLIRRIQQTTGRPTAYPHVPRCFHAGWYGYNRWNKMHPAALKGTLEEKIAKVQATIYDQERARLAAINPGWYADSQPVNLNIRPWKTLKQSQP
jgi:hypothetical protein